MIFSSRFPTYNTSPEYIVYGKIKSLVDKCANKYIKWINKVKVAIICEEWHDQAGGV